MPFNVLTPKHPAQYKHVRNYDQKVTSQCVTQSAYFLPVIDTGDVIYFAAFSASFHHLKCIPAFQLAQLYFNSTHGNHVETMQNTARE